MTTLMLLNQACPDNVPFWLRATLASLEILKTCANSRCLCIFRRWASTSVAVANVVSDAYVLGAGKEILIKQFVAFRGSRF